MMQRYRNWTGPWDCLATLTIAPATRCKSLGVDMIGASFSASRFCLAEIIGIDMIGSFGLCAEGVVHLVRMVKMKMNWDWLTRHGRVAAVGIFVFIGVVAGAGRGDAELSCCGTPDERRFAT